MQQFNIKKIAGIIILLIISGIIYSYIQNKYTAYAPDITSDTTATDSLTKLPDEIYQSSTPDLFTWIVRENIEHNYDVFLKTASGEHEIIKDAHDCVAVNMFDAPDKKVKNLEYPTLKCAMNTTAEFYGVYNKDKTLTVKNVNADKCDQYGSCDLKRESKGQVIN